MRAGRVRACIDNSGASIGRGIDMPLHEYRPTFDRHEREVCRLFVVL